MQWCHHVVAILRSPGHMQHQWEESARQGIAWLWHLLAIIVKAPSQKVRMPLAGRFKACLPCDQVASLKYSQVPAMLDGKVHAVG